MNAQQPNNTGFQAQVQSLTVSQPLQAPTIDIASGLGRAMDGVSQYLRQAEMTKKAIDFTTLKSDIENQGKLDSERLKTLDPKTGNLIYQDGDNTVEVNYGQYLTESQQRIQQMNQSFVDKYKTLIPTKDKFDIEIDATNHQLPQLYAMKQQELDVNMLHHQVEQKTLELVNSNQPLTTKIRSISEIVSHTPNTSEEQRQAVIKQLTGASFEATLRQHKTTYDKAIASFQKETDAYKLQAMELDASQAFTKAMEATNAEVEQLKAVAPQLYQVIKSDVQSQVNTAYNNQAKQQSDVTGLFVARQEQTFVNQSQILDAMMPTLLMGQGMGVGANELRKAQELYRGLPKQLQEQYQNKITAYNEAVELGKSYKANGGSWLSIDIANVHPIMQGKVLELQDQEQKAIEHAQEKLEKQNESIAGTIVNMQARGFATTQEVLKLGEAGIPLPEGVLPISPESLQFAVEQVHAKGGTMAEIVSELKKNGIDLNNGTISSAKAIGTIGEVYGVPAELARAMTTMHGATKGLSVITEGYQQAQTLLGQFNQSERQRLVESYVRQTGGFVGSLNNNKVVGVLSALAIDKMKADNMDMTKLQPSQFKPYFEKEVQKYKSFHVNQKITGMKQRINLSQFVPLKQSNFQHLSLGNVAKTVPQVTDNILTGYDRALANSTVKGIKVSSAYRDAQRNAKAGGSKTSDHLHGTAIDFDIPQNLVPKQAAEVATRLVVQAAAMSDSSSRKIQVGVHPQDATGMMIKYIKETGKKPVGMAPTEFSLIKQHIHRFEIVSEAGKARHLHIGIPQFNVRSIGSM